MIPRTSRQELQFSAYLSLSRHNLYRQLAGFSRRDLSGAISRRYAHLAAADRVLEDRRRSLDSGQKTDDANARRARLRYGERLSISLALAANKERSVAWQALGQTIDVPGARVTLREIPSLISAETDPERRHFLQKTHETAMVGANPPLAALWQRLNAACLDLHGQSYRLAMSEAKGIDTSALIAVADTFLHYTDDIFVAAKATWAEALDLPDKGLSQFDIPVLFKGAPWADLFTAPVIESVAHKVLVLFGQQNNPGLHLDLTLRPGKAARPFLAPIKVPERLVLVARPSGGHRDAEELLHEVGHALCFLHIPSESEWEDRLLWSDSVAEASAYLVAGLLRNPHFLTDVCNIPAARADRFVSYASFLELWMARRYAAKVLQEFAWHDAGCPGEATGYSAWMARALGIETPDVYFLPELDEGLYAAEYLQAWFLEAELHTFLTRTWGFRWWQESDAGHWLQALWQQGGLLDMGQLLRELNISSLSAQTLADRLSEGVRITCSGRQRQ